MADKHTYNMKYIWTISLVAALGGLLFGYDWVVIGGAKPFYEAYFNLTTPFQIGWAMSSALVGCMAGSILSGGLSDKFGRKRLLIFSGFMFTLSAVGTGWAQGYNAFIIYRLIGGVGIGLASNLSPMYIAEVSPANVRGRFVSINQLTIVIGILAAQVINYLIADTMATEVSREDILASWNGQWGWRWMFWAETIPAFMFFLFMFIVPESPRWLVKNSSEQKAENILTKIGGSDYSQTVLPQIRQSLVHEIKTVHFSELFEKNMLKILIIGVVLAVFQQWCGINVIFNYAHEIFTQAGYSVSGMLFNIVITGIVNLAFTFVAIFTVDHWGRKKLMLLGSGGLAIIYLLLGISYSRGVTGLPIVLLVVTAIACYACTLAPVTWVLISEIFSNRIRGAAMSISVTMLWIACFILTYTFPMLNSGLGAAWTFWIYAVICVMGFCFIKSRLTETKGKSLEEIEIELIGKPESENNSEPAFPS